MGEGVTDEAMWQASDGTWTPASFLIRDLFEDGSLAPCELYFVLTSLGVEERFKCFWNNPRFFQRAGWPDKGSPWVHRREEGGIVGAGDNAWATGDLDEAMRCYQRSIDEGDSTVVAGIGGLVRLHFVRGEFSKCVAAFRRACPPHAFFMACARAIGGKQHFAMPREKDMRRTKLFTRLSAEYPGKSPYFVPRTKDLRDAIVAAAVRAGEIDDALYMMICDYFALDVSRLDDLIRAYAKPNSDNKVTRLQSRIAPRPVVFGRTLDDLRGEGDTEKGRRILGCVTRYEEIVDASCALLDAFLKTGDPARLDQMIREGSPFGINNADALILTSALERREDAIAKLPERRLVLLRRFSKILRHPAKYRYPRYGSFLENYIEVMRQVKAEIEPADVMAAILDLPWHKTPYAIDNTGPFGSHGGLGKPEIGANREWLEIILRDYQPIRDRRWLECRNRAIEFLYRAYEFLRERFSEVHEDGLVEEAKLAEAIAILFGRGKVHRHARPLWVQPQHLDLFLPEMGLAIEYMGAQHYEPIDHFGGSEGLEESKGRDERKRVLCDKMGVDLVYVTHEEDVGLRAKEIHDQYGCR